MCTKGRPIGSGTGRQQYGQPGATGCMEEYPNPVVLALS